MLSTGDRLLVSNITDRLKVQWWEKMYHVNNYKKATAIILSHKSYRRHLKMKKGQSGIKTQQF
jgi:hypothetical protein